MRIASRVSLLAAAAPAGSRVLPLATTVEVRGASRAQLGEDGEASEIVPIAVPPGFAETDRLVLLEPLQTGWTPATVVRVFGPDSPVCAVCGIPIDASEPDAMFDGVADSGARQLAHHACQLQRRSAWRG